MPDLTNNPGSEDHTETVISILGNPTRPLSTRCRPNITIPVADDECSGEFPRIGTPGDTPRGSATQRETLRDSARRSEVLSETPTGSDATGRCRTPREKLRGRETPVRPLGETPRVWLTPRETPKQTPESTPRETSGEMPTLRDVLKEIPQPQKTPPSRKLSVEFQQESSRELKHEPQGKPPKAPQRPRRESQKSVLRRELSSPQLRHNTPVHSDTPYNHDEYSRTTKSPASYLPDVDMNIAQRNSQAMATNVNDVTLDDVTEEHVTVKQGQRVESTELEERVHHGKRTLCTPASYYTEFSELQHSVSGGGKDTPAAERGSG